MSFNYIICAAGEGTRTSIVNPAVPKPLLKLDNKTFLEISLSSFKFDSADNIYVVGQKNHNLKQANDEISRNLNLPPAKINWLEIDSCTDGQLATALIGFKAAGSPDNILLYNCDTYFDGTRLNEKLSDRLWEGLIPCSIESGDSWSFSRVKQFSDCDVMETLQVEEKKRISDLCSVGLYFFRSGELFAEYARRESNEVSGTEKYIAPLYNRYIAENKKIGTLLVKNFKAFGSTEQISKYWNKSIYEMQEMNRSNRFKKLA